MENLHDDFIKDVPILNENGVKHSFDKNENIKATQGGTSKEYRLAKLKRDFGEEAVIEAAKTHKTASALERHFGVGKPLLTPIERLERAFTRLSEEEKADFLKRIGHAP